MGISIAPNVQAAAIAAVIAPIILHVLTQYGLTLPPDAEDALPGAVAVVVAHVWDLCTGGNKPTVVTQAQPSSGK